MTSTRRAEWPVTMLGHNSPGQTTASRQSALVFPGQATEFQKQHTAWPAPSAATCHLCPHLLSLKVGERGNFRISLGMSVHGEMSLGPTSFQIDEQALEY